MDENYRRGVDMETKIAKIIRLGDVTFLSVGIHSIPINNIHYVRHNQNKNHDYNSELGVEIWLKNEKSPIFIANKVGGKEINKLLYNKSINSMYDYSQQ